MAAPIACGYANNLAKIFYRCVRNKRISSALINYRLKSTTKSEQSEKDLEELFVKPEVQAILRNITGFNLDKIFRSRPTEETQAPKYKLLTEKQLKQYEKDAFARGVEKLQMPPVKKAWSGRDVHSQILSSDPDIADFDTSGIRYVFTDISYSLPKRNRVVVVREPDGTLRLADNEERDRVLQVYFPSPGKTYHTPKMFDEDLLERVLGEHRYEYVLDRACVQFEPDDPKYIRVAQRTYEHIANEKRFDNLRSTRHFGPMAFYFAFHQRIDALLVDMLHRDLMNDAEELVRLYHILHPECESSLSAQQQKLSGIPLIQSFAKQDATNGGIIEMALQSYEETHHSKLQLSDKS